MTSYPTDEYLATDPPPTAWLYDAIRKVGQPVDRALPAGVEIAGHGTSWDWRWPEHAVQLTRVDSTWHVLVRGPGSQLGWALDRRPTDAEVIRLVATAWDRWPTR